MKPKILVTGANGYTGYWFCRFLAEKGESIRALYYGPDGKPDLDNPLIELHANDIRDKEDLKKHFEGIEIVYHIAALYRPTNVKPRAFYEVNVEGTRNMVELASEAGVKKFVHCSTMGVHGTVGRTSLTEDAPIQPDDYYQETKWEGEKLALELSKKLKLPLAVIRPAGIYGPREKRFLKITQLVKKGRFVMFGSGETFYHFVHVHDLCRAFVLAAHTDKSNGRAYIIGDEKAQTIQHFVDCLADSAGVKRPKVKIPYFIVYLAALFFEAICKPLGISPPMHRRRANWFVSNRTFDISRAMNELGYRQEVPFEKGIQDMVDSYKEMGWLS